MTCRYGLSADIYSFGITVIEAALGHTPYVDMSFEQIVTKKAVNAGVPMLAVNTHGRHFSQVRRRSQISLCTHPALALQLVHCMNSASSSACSPAHDDGHFSLAYGYCCFCPAQEQADYCRSSGTQLHSVCTTAQSKGHQQSSC